MEETQQKFKDEALHDPLTGLLNRRGLMNAIQGCLAYLQRQRHSAAFFMIDLDHFKHINDKHGHDVGDQVLQRLAATLATRLRQSDVVARLLADVQRAGRGVRARPDAIPDAPAQRLAVLAIEVGRAELVASERKRFFRPSCIHSDSYALQPPGHVFPWQ